MCGIAGALGIAASSEPIRAAVARIIDSQYRRGPDHQEVEVVRDQVPHVVLGHNRLSIIDLSDAANMPMWDSTGRYCLVFNGEIYNYLELREELRALGRTFRTQGDSEVILEAYKQWGVEALAKFNGMFAFGLWCETEQRLWLVRDRFGVKPLYFHQTAESLIFASTPGEIARECGARPNPAYIARGIYYMVYEDAGPMCQYEEIMALPAGHYMEVSLSGAGAIETRQVAYYSLAERVQALIDANAGKSLEALVEMLAERLETSLRLRLRSDVPVGISLSGGLDSSTIAAKVAAMNPQIIGFSYGHPEHPESEGPVVKVLEEKLGLSVDYVWPAPHRFIEAFWETIDAQDAPFVGPNIVAQYLVYEAARARNVKVVLGGQGADEALMGYRKYLMFRLQQLRHERRFVQLLGFCLSLVPTAVQELRSFSSYWNSRHRFSRRVSVDLSTRFECPEPLDLGYDREKPLWYRQVVDFSASSLPTLLRYEDRNSMANSVESRLPFMDYEFVEMAIALPIELKIREGYGKWVLRELARDIVPRHIARARFKLGFDVSIERAIQAGFGDSLRERIRGGTSSGESWLKQGVKIEESFSNHRLMHHPTALREAISLAWIGARYGT